MWLLLPLSEGPFKLASAGQANKSMGLVTACPQQCGIASAGTEENPHSSGLERSLTHAGQPRHIDPMGGHQHFLSFPAETKTLLAIIQFTVA